MSPASLPLPALPWGVGSSHPCWLEPGQTVPHKKPGASQLAGLASFRELTSLPGACLGMAQETEELELSSLGPCPRVGTAERTNYAVSLCM